LNIRGERGWIRGVYLLAGRRIEKNGREIITLPERFIFPSSLLPVVCFLRNQSVFIMIAQDSLSFGFLLFVCFVMNGKGILSQDQVLDAYFYFVKS